MSVKHFWNGCKLAVSVLSHRGDTQGGREATLKYTRSNSDVLLGTENCPDFFRISKFKIDPGGNILWISKNIRFEYSDIFPDFSSLL